MTMTTSAAVLRRRAQDQAAMASPRFRLGLRMLAPDRSESRATDARWHGRSPPSPQAVGAPLLVAGGPHLGIQGRRIDQAADVRLVQHWNALKHVTSTLRYPSRPEPFPVASLDGVSDYVAQFERLWTFCATERVGFGGGHECHGPAGRAVYRAAAVLLRDRL
jgi:hypothetical protein